jgi:hypothetical protein
MRQTEFLSDVQRSVKAAKEATAPHGGSRDRAQGNVTQTEAAEKWNVSVRAVRKANAILKRGIPALVRLLEADGMSLDKAAQMSRLSPAEQRDAVNSYLADQRAAKRAA